ERHGSRPAREVEQATATACRGSAAQVFDELVGIQKPVSVVVRRGSAVQIGTELGTTAHDAASAEARNDVLAHQVDRLHPGLVPDLVRVHETEEEVDSCGLITLARVEALLRSAEHTRTRIDEVFE